MKNALSTYAEKKIFRKLFLALLCQKVNCTKIDPLPQMSQRFNIHNNRKRRRDSDGVDGFEAEGKKDKKDYDNF